MNHNTRHTDRSTAINQHETDGQPEPDLSAGWREEYRHNNVPIPDGGVAVGNGDGPTPIDVEQLVDRVHVHQRFELQERETSLYWNEDTNLVRIHSLERGVTRRLLRHPLFGVQHLKIGAGGGMRVIEPRAAVERYPEADIVGVAGDIPIGAVKIGLSARATGGHADVVTGRVTSEGRVEL